MSVLDLQVCRAAGGRRRRRRLSESRSALSNEGWLPWAGVPRKEVYAQVCADLSESRSALSTGGWLPWAGVPRKEVYAQECADEAGVPGTGVSPEPGVVQVETYALESAGEQECSLGQE